MTKNKNFFLDIILILMLQSGAGLLNYFVLGKNDLALLIKSNMFEFTSLVLILYFFIFINKNKFKLIDYFLFIIIISHIFISFIKDNNITTFLLSFKETFLLPLLLIVFYKIKDKTNNLLIIRWVKLLNILALIFTLINFTVGWEVFTSFFTGESFFGVNDHLNFKISTFYGIIRTPSIIGESAGYGFFSAISAFILFKDKSKSRYFWLIISLLNVFFSTSRSAYLFLFIFCFINILKDLQNNKYKAIKKIVYYIIIIIMVIIVVINIIITMERIQIFSFESTKIRFSNWKNLNFDNINIFEIFFGKGFGSAGQSLKEGFIGTLDNLYLLLFFQIGVIGLFIFYSVLYVYLPLEIFLPFVFSSFFTSLTQGEAVLVYLPFVILFYKKRRKYD